jgi:hypothetical protein
VASTLTEGRIIRLIDDNGEMNFLDTRWLWPRKAGAAICVLMSTRPNAEEGLERGVQKVGNRYKVVLRHNGKQIWLGAYSTKEEANAVSRKAVRELHGQYGYTASRSGKFFRRA